MNSSADIKAFCGQHGGAVCTSSNAQAALEWAFEQKGRTPRCSSCPTSTWAATPPCSSMGLALDDCVVWNPLLPGGGLDARAAARRADDPLEGPLLGARPLLRRTWSTSCGATIPGVQILVHPECRYEVVHKADLVGSTEFIIKTVEAAPAGSSWAIGTELNLVKRLADAHPEQEIVFLDRTVCYCSTMNRIDLPHLVWALESLAEGQRRQRDRGRPRHRALGQGRAPADARPARASSHRD